MKKILLLLTMAVMLTQQADANTTAENGGYDGKNSATATQDSGSNRWFETLIAVIPAASLLAVAGGGFIPIDKRESVLASDKKIPAGATC